VFINWIEYHRKGSVESGIVELESETQSQSLEYWKFQSKVEVIDVGLE